MTDSTSPTKSPGITAWLVYLPLVLWLLLLVVAPGVVLILYSFCDRDELGQPIYQFTLDNYREIFEPGWMTVFRHTAECAIATAINAIIIVAIFRRRFSTTALRYGLLLGGGGFLSYAIRHLSSSDDSEQGTYLKIFWRSAELAATTTLLCLIAGYPVAYFIGRASARFRNRLLLLVMIPFWTSFLIRTYAWITILNQNGLLNSTLRAVHLSQLIPATGGILYTPVAVVIGLVYAYLPFMILPIYSSVEKLDNSLIEASLDLGAGPWRTIAHVILPITKPGMIAGILLVFVPAIGMFAVTDLMSGNRFPLLGGEIENQFGQANNQPLGAALGVTLMLMFGLAFLVTGFTKPRGIE